MAWYDWVGLAGCVAVLLIYAYMKGWDTGYWKAVKECGHGQDYLGTRRYL